MRAQSVVDCGECSVNWHPLSSLVVGAGRAWVLSPPVPWCRALVAMGVVRHHFPILEGNKEIFMSLIFLSRN